VATSPYTKKTDANLHIAGDLSVDGTAPYVESPVSPAASTFLKYVSSVWSAVLLALADLPGQITTTRKFLTSAGNGTTAGVPFYDTLGASDIPSIPSSKLSDLGTSSGAASLTSGVVPWAQLPASARNATVNAVLDNGAAALTTQEIEARTNTPGTLSAWAVWFPPGVSGSVSIDVYKATLANALTNTWTKISSTSPLVVSSAAGASGTAFTGWTTTTITDGDVLRFVVTSATTATRAYVALEIQRS